MTVIYFVGALIAGDAYFFRVDDNDVVAGVDVWGVNRLVFATKTLAISLARRPSGRAVASTTYQSCTTVSGFAL